MHAKTTRAARRCPFFFTARGFSLPELIAVILLVSIIAVVVAPKLPTGFGATQGFYDKAVSVLSYSRKAAIAQRRVVFIRIDASAGTLEACYNAAGACSAVPPPPGPGALSLVAPGGVTVGPTITFQFDPLGRYLDSAGANPPSSLAISVAGDGSYTITVEHETGYVR